MCESRSEQEGEQREREVGESRGGRGGCPGSKVKKAFREVESIQMCQMLLQGRVGMRIFHYIYKVGCFG